MATPRSTQLSFSFQPKLRVDFLGGQMTTDPGLLLLRELDERLGLTRAFDRAVADGRDGRYIEHGMGDLLRQRVYQIAAGYEDAVDANLLRHDPTFQTLIDPDGDGDPLAGQSTISRLENAANWKDIGRLSDLSLTWFLRHGSKLRDSKRQEILLDVDSTEDPTHGHQQLSLFHGKYNTYMYHPLLIFEGHTGHLLSSRLRPGTAADSQSLLPELRRMLPRLRRAFPGAPIALRGDAGFTSPELRDFLEQEGIVYLLGIPQYKQFREFTAPMIDRARQRFDRTGQRVRLFSSFFYRGKKWPRRRRILVKVEVSAQGTNVRCVVTNKQGRSETLFKEYNGRGEVENRIDELKNDIKADRLSCTRYRANAFRLQLHTLAYNLMHVLRRWLQGTALENAEASTIRLQLFKVGARIQRTVRHVWFHLASGWPYQNLFAQAHRAIRRRAPAPT